LPHCAQEPCPAFPFTQSAANANEENKTATGLNNHRSLRRFTAAGVIPYSIPVLFPAPSLFVQSALKIERADLQVFRSLTAVFDDF